MTEEQVRGESWLHTPDMAWQAWSSQAPLVLTLDGGEVADESGGKPDMCSLQFHVYVSTEATGSFSARNF